MLILAHIDFVIFFIICTNESYENYTPTKAVVNGLIKIMSKAKNSTAIFIMSKTRTMPATFSIILNLSTNSIQKWHIYS